MSGEPIDSRSVSLQKSGGGASVYLPAEWKKKFGIEAGDEVTVDLVNTDSGLELKVRDVGDGFTLDEFQDMAENNDWSCTDSYNEVWYDEVWGDQEEWSFAYNTGDVTVSIDSDMTIDGMVVNNVFVRAVPIQLGIDSVESYEQFHKRVNGMRDSVRQSFVIGFNDSDGLWQKLVASNDADVNEGGLPDIETMEALIEQTDWVNAEIKWAGSSLRTSLETVEARVETLQEVYNALNK